MTTTCDVCQHRTGDDTRMCAECAERLRAQLQEVPRIAADLLTSRTGYKASTLTMNRKRADRPMPIRPDAGRPLDDRRDDLALAVLGSADAVARATGEELRNVVADRHLRARAAQARADRNPDPAALTDDRIGNYEAAAIWLSEHTRDLRRHPAAAAMHEQIVDAVAAARNATDDHRPKSYKGPCPECGTGLYTDPGAPTTRCPRCRAQYVTADLDNENLDRARDTLVTIPEALRLLADLGQPVPRSTVYRWRTDRRITARGYRHNGRTTDHQPDPRDPAVYRLGDILDAANRTAAA